MAEDEVVEASGFVAGAIGQTAHGDDGDSIVIQD